MSFEWFVAFRYLTARRKQAFISMISLVSILGVGVGVMALVVATALMTGTQNEMRDRIVGASAHVYVSKMVDGGFKDVEAESRRLQVPGVVGIAPAVQGLGLIQATAGDKSPLQIKGIDPAREGSVTDLATSMIAGSVEALNRTSSGDESPPDPILLGSDLAARLRVSVGDTVQILTAEAVATPMGPVPRLRVFEVVGIFKLGFYEFDSQYGLIRIETAQEFLSQPGPGLLQLRLADMDRAPEIAARLQEQLGPGYLVQDWTELNGPLYSALWLEKMAIALTIGLIVMVAALNIVASLILLVMEKSRDIGILRTMGASAGSIRRIFILQGMTIGAIGTGTGTILGLLVCWVCERYRLFELPPDVYQITYLRFQVVPLDVLTIVGSALAICLLATVYPSRRASALDPAEALRYQ